MADLVVVSVILQCSPLKSHKGYTTSVSRCRLCCLVNYVVRCVVWCTSCCTCAKGTRSQRNLRTQSRVDEIER